ncbi:DUF4817 domain-containing protein [Caenorhabditis elegans]|uniref:DUF4817 domain-containing protein n=1 Tax=Caenorhabditis elegans TaxID=6239 RepID=O17688_CAEEL|nr:DUF4817 domain-containing protein [Caenorhabditis elegans]CAB02851.3 DUF4817 domain-containing protein [Caenorhabditis elegans]|eukprot:NP_506297.3 Uncharacterized protein CELE_C50B6.1 [Caenorhabditis elegans]
MLLQVMDRTKWPQGSVDRQKVADKVNLAYHQITHQYRVHPENQMYMQNSKRQTREKITSEQKFQLEKALLENPKPLMGSVDREHFRREKCPTVRRDQFEHFLKRN